MKWPKPKFWLLGAFILFVLRMVIVTPQGEYAWLNYAISEEGGTGFLFGYGFGLVLQVAIITFICSSIWDAYKKSKQEI
ncbi:MAG: hypothetical protein OEY81_02975 [Candidatus Bathyarchaeota archaeon]|nr:hypothetical protein [Candidatus Bathyarchaeota archaeon]